MLAPIGGPVAVDFPISYGPTPNGGVIALKLTDAGGKMELTPAWLSRDMMTAEPPVVANGVVFVLAAGEFTGQANDEDGGLYSLAGTDEAIDSGEVICTRCRNRQGAVFERGPDNFLPAPGRHRGCRWPSNFWHVRWDNLLLRPE